MRLYFDLCSIVHGVEHAIVDGGVSSALALEHAETNFVAILCWLRRENTTIDIGGKKGRQHLEQGFNFCRQQARVGCLREGQRRMRLSRR